MRSRYVNSFHLSFLPCQIVWNGYKVSIARSVKASKFCILKTKSSSLDQKLYYGASILQGLSKRICKDRVTSLNKKFYYILIRSSVRFNYNSPLFLQLILKQAMKYVVFDHQSLVCTNCKLQLEFGVFKSHILKAKGSSLDNKLCYRCIIQKESR